MIRISKSTPGYQQLKYLVENYSNEPEGPEMVKWLMWLRERDIEKKLSLAGEMWEDKTRREDIKKKLEKNAADPSRQPLGL